MMELPPVDSVGCAEVHSSSASSIRAASSRGSSSGASLADGLEVLQNVSDDLRLRIGMLTFVTQNYYLFGDYASAKILA